MTSTLVIPIAQTSMTGGSAWANMRLLTTWTPLWYLLEQVQLNLLWGSHIEMSSGEQPPMRMIFSSESRAKIDAILS